MEIASSLQQLDWGVAQRNLPGEDALGDLYVVQPHREGVLFAVVDGCGHGPDAAQAAMLAVTILRDGQENTVHGHLHRCHVALADSRGAVMTLADYNSRRQTLTICGVGNVEATLFRAAPDRSLAAQERALLRLGVVGAQLPTPYASVLRVMPGDVLVMASDGLHPTFDREQALLLSPQRVAEILLEKNYKGTDDAVALVARFREHDHE